MYICAKPLRRSSVIVEQNVRFDVFEGAESTFTRGCGNEKTAKKRSRMTMYVNVSAECRNSSLQFIQRTTWSVTFRLPCSVCIALHYITFLKWPYCFSKKTSRSTATKVRLGGISIALANDLAVGSPEQLGSSVASGNLQETPPLWRKVEGCSRLWRLRLQRLCRRRWKVASKDDQRRRSRGTQSRATWQVGGADDVT